MNHNHPRPGSQGQPQDRRSPLNFEPDPKSSYLRITLIILALAAAVIYLLTNHWLHVLDALPYVLVLGFLGMHLFGHGGHGANQGHESDEGEGHDK